MLRSILRLLSKPCASDHQIVAGFLGTYFKGGCISASTQFRPSHIQLCRSIITPSVSQPCNNDNYSFTDTYLGRNNVELEPNRSEDVVLHIVRWLDCSDEEASQISHSMPQLRSVHLETIDGYVEFLKESGITFSLLRQNLWLLEQSITTMRPKIRIVSAFGINSITVPLLKVSRRSLRIYILRHGTSDLQNRLAFISQSLECTREEVMELIMKDCRWFILTMKYDRLVLKMGLLLDHGVAPSDIRDDLWVFKNDENHLRVRLCRATAAKVEPIKPWMLRCTDRNFLKLVERKQGIGGDRHSYLVERLGYSHQEIASLLRRHTNLVTMSFVKMKNVVDLLYANGISSEQIYNYPSIFHYRLDVLDSRLKELESIGLKAPKRLHVLCSKRRTFLNALQEMKCNDEQIKFQKSDLQHKTQF